MELGKLLRGLQILLVLGAVLAGLSWFEDTGESDHRQIAEQTLEIRTEAAVQTPRGPWGPGTTFTQDHAGVPLDVAPTLNVTAQHGSPGLAASDHAWSATLRYEATGEEGGIWWRTTQPLALEPDGSTATLALDLPRTIQDARSLADAADVPSRLTIEVAITHDADLVLDGEARSTQHTASLGLVPREGFVVLDTRDDGSTYSQPVEEERDWTPLALLAPALLAEGGIRLHRRGDPSWRHRRGVQAVEVTDLGKGTEAHRTSFEALVRLARTRNQPVLVDRQAGRARLAGDPPLSAPVPEAEEATASSEG